MSASSGTCMPTNVCVFTSVFNLSLSPKVSILRIQSFVIRTKLATVLNLIKTEYKQKCCHVVF